MRRAAKRKTLYVIIREKIGVAFDQFAEKFLPMTGVTHLTRYRAKTTCAGTRTQGVLTACLVVGPGMSGSARGVSLIR